MAELDALIYLRNDTAANWSSKDPVLGKGEMGIEIDTRKAKYGDGVTAWSSLLYAGLTEEEVQTLLDKYMLVSTYASATSGVVKQADKVTNSLSINGKTYNGSATVSITADDIAALLPADLVHQSDYGTTNVGGTIKSGSASNIGQVVIAGNGIGSVSKVASTSSSDKVANKLTINGKEFDGSSAVSIEGGDIDALLPEDVVREDDYGTTAKGGSIKSGSSSVVGQVVITNGIGSVAKVSNASSADKVASKLTFVKANGAKADISYDGSAVVAIPIANSQAAGLVRSAGSTGGNAVLFDADGYGNVPVVEANSVEGDLPEGVTYGGETIASQAYVIAAIDSKLADLSKAALIKGTLGEGGTVTQLPTTGVSTGDMYQVITAGTYAGLTVSPGDWIIATSNTPTWEALQGNLEGTVISNETIGASDAGAIVVWNADGTVGKAIKIATVLTQSTTFSGAVNGTYNHLALGNKVVEASNIADGTITDAQMAAASLSTDKLFVPTGSKLIINGGGA